MKRGVNDLRTIKQIALVLEQDLSRLRLGMEPPKPLLRRIASQCGLLEERIQERKKEAPDA